MRKILAYFIQFPVAVNVALIAIFIFGLSGLSLMNFSIYPQFPNTIITINLTNLGASPTEMEEGIVLKIEDNLKGISGIDAVTSTTSENKATIIIETLDTYDIDFMLQKVKNAVDRVPSFPTGMEPPIIDKEENLSEVIGLALSGEEVPLKTLKKIAYQIEDDIRDMKGISKLKITGFPAEEIEIAVREKDLFSKNLTFGEVADAVANANILATGGNIKTKEEDYLIRATNRAYQANELDFIVIRADQNGKVIRLKDIATVKDKWSENPDRIYLDGAPAVQIKVFTTNEEAYLKASNLMLAYTEKFNAQRDNVQLTITADRSVDLRERTRILSENGIFGMILVLILLSLFLKPSLAFWVAVGLPVSFLAMFMVVPTLVTLNAMTLFGMILVIGILVDDGIVIGENIYAHYEMGKSPTRAAIDGTMEVATAIVSAILTTVVAFSSFFFLKGKFGDFYFEVAVIVVITLLFSLVEALIFLPSHIANSRAMKRKGKNYLLNTWANGGINWLRDNLYAPLLKFFLTYRILGFCIPLALFFMTIGALRNGVIPTAFFPSIASDRITINLNMPEGTNEDITVGVMERIESAANQVNETFTAKQTGGKSVVQNMVRRIGPGTAVATLEVNLLMGEERDFAADVLANAIEAEVGPVYGVEKLVYGSGINFGGLPVSIALTGSNIKELKGAKETLKAAFQKNPKLKDITDNDPAGIKEIELSLKENAYLLGLNLNSVMSQVRAGFFGQSVQRFQRGRDEVKVWVRYDRAERESIKNLADMRIMTPSGDRVRLSEIANYFIERGEVSINHLNGRREIKVEADLKNSDDSSVEMLASIQDDIMPDIIARYPSVTPVYQGQSRETAKMRRSFHITLPIVFFLMYGIIAFSFRSYFQPLLLFILIPFSLVGVFWGHWLHDFPVSVLSSLGVVALIGILINDGLVLVSKFNVYLKEGMPFEEALFQAGCSRFRAILLTSVTTVAGMMPLIFETARNAKFIIPMAITISYGIAYSTFLTLFLLPILLYFSNSFKLARIWLFTGKKPSRASIENAVSEEVAKEKVLEEY